MESTLSDIGIPDVPIIKVYNKIDLLPDKEELLKRNGLSDGLSLYISAKTGDGIPDLKSRLRAVLFREMELFYLRIPSSEKDLIRSFSKWAVVLKRRENGDYSELKIMANPLAMVNYSPYIKRGEENW